MERSAQLVFGPFRLDLEQKVLWRGEELIKLRPMAVAVLQMLVEHSGEVVAKEKLLKKIWADTYVTKTVLKVCISEIREALGDDAKTPRYIETVGRQGYRFLAERELEEVFIRAPDSSRSGEAYIVGRARELRQLAGWFDKAVRGTRQVVFVTGEPGIGKTTLVDLFLGQLHTDSRLRIGRGQCLEQYGEGEPYLPVFDALGRLCREPGKENMKALLGQYAPTWLVQMPAVLTEAEIASLQTRVQGATRQRMLREMADAIEALTRDSPLVLFLEDLHWSDHSTLELLSYLAQRQERTRLLLIGTYRPADLTGEHPLKKIKRELHVRRQCWELPVGLLSQKEVATYLGKRLPEWEVPETLARAIHRRTEGNALFMVNVVDALIGQKLLVAKEQHWELQGGIENLSVPESLRQVIEQKLEQLSIGDQQLLEVASVEGEEFTAAALAAAIGKDVLEIEEHCAALARQGQFISERGTSEWPVGTVAARFGFVHALYHEVLYDRITPARRAHLHCRIGESLEKGYGDRAREIAAELALHFERGRGFHRAIQYLQYAAENASQRFAYHENVGLLTRGLSLLQHLPDSSDRMHQELHWQISLGVALMAIKGYAAPEAKHAYDRARELCQQIGDTPQLVPVLKGLAAFYYVRAELQTAREIGEQLLRIAQEEGDPSLLLEAHQELGGTLSSLGEFRTALDHLEKGIRLYDPEKHHSHRMIYGQDPGVSCLCRASHALWFLGYPDQALSKGCEALVLAEKLGHPHSLAYARSFVAILHMLRREVREAEIQAKVAIDLSTTLDFPTWMAASMIVQGWALVHLGWVEEGLLQIHSGLTAWQRVGAEIARPQFLGLLADAYGVAARVVEGLAIVDESLELVAKNKDRWWEAELYRLKGELLLRSHAQERGAQISKTKRYAGGLRSAISNPQLATEAEGYFQKALAVSRHQQAKSLELRAAVSLARLWQYQRRQIEAWPMLMGTYNWFSEGLDLADLCEAQSLLNMLQLDVLGSPCPPRASM